VSTSAKGSFSMTQLRHAPKSPRLFTSRSQYCTHLLNVCTSAPSLQQSWRSAIRCGQLMAQYGRVMLASGGPTTIWGLQTPGSAEGIVEMEVDDIVNDSTNVGDYRLRWVGEQAYVYLPFFMFLCLCFRHRSSLKECSVYSKPPDIITRPEHSRRPVVTRPKLANELSQGSMEACVRPVPRLTSDVGTPSSGWLR
jgi:hypothetical protein